MLSVYALSSGVKFIFFRVLSHTNVSVLWVFKRRLHTHKCMYSEMIACYMCICIHMCTLYVHIGACDGGGERGRERDLSKEEGSLSRLWGKSSWQLHIGLDQACGIRHNVPFLTFAIPSPKWVARGNERKKKLQKAPVCSPWDLAWHSFPLPFSEGSFPWIGRPTHPEEHLRVTSNMRLPATPLQGFLSASILITDTINTPYIPEGKPGCGAQLLTVNVFDRVTPCSSSTRTSQWLGQLKLERFEAGVGFTIQATSGPKHCWT